MDIYDLSFPQKNIYMVENTYNNSSINLITGILKIKKVFDFKLAQKVCSLMCKSFDNFNIQILEKNGEVYQSFKNYIEKDFEKLDIYDKQKLDIYLNNISKEPFNIKEKLYELILIKTSDNDGMIVVKLHHLISDAWTFSMVGKFLSDTYVKLLNNENIEDIKSNSYIDFLNNEKEYLNSEKYIKDKNYWDNYLKDINIVTKLKDKNIINNNAKRYSIVLDKNRVDKINNYCKNNKVSIYNLFMGIISTYVYRTTENNDIILGTPVLNRSNFKQKNTMGMFISTMPVRIKIEENMKFIDLIKNIGKDSLSLFRHQRYPISESIKEYHKNNENDKLYNIVFSYQNAKINNLNNEIYSSTWIPNNCIADELEIHIFDTDDSGKLFINYDYLQDLFEDVEIEYIHTRFMSIIDNAIENENINVENISIMNDYEKNLILNKFNDTNVKYSKNETVIDLFEKQVENNQDNIAMVFEDKKLTYKELNERVNSLANYLRKEKNIQTNDVVALYLKRSIDVYISILAILKCGASYLPIDISFPKDRVDYMIENSQCKLLITNLNCSYNNVLDLTIVNYENYSNKNLDIDINLNNLCYMIYTSGTTGKPKGVQILHRNLFNLVKATVELQSLNENTKFGVFSTYSFDINVLEALIPLFTGKTIYIANEIQQVNPKEIYNIITSNKIEVIYMTPSRLKLLLNSDYANCLINIKKLMLGGEELKVKFYKDIIKYTNAIIYNGYGPSEITVWSSVKIVKNENNINIGKPINNTKTYILDEKNRLLPISVKGNLCIGGAGVGAGYYNNDNLTKSKFIEYDNTKVYISGDLGKFDFNGELHYDGRKDFQIKINGIRTEIGDIEKNIVSLDFINDCIVIFNNNILEAYIVGDYKGQDLKKLLLNKMPKQIIPKKFYILDKIPLNKIGKIDRKLLITMKDKPIDFLLESSLNNKLKDENKEEILKLKELFNKCNISNKGYSIDVYTDSLLMIKLIVAINDTFNVDLTLTEIYNCYNMFDVLDLINKHKKIKLKDNIILNEVKLNQSLINIYFASLKNNKMYCIPFELNMGSNIDNIKLKTSIENVLKNNQIFSARVDVRKKDIFFVFDINNHKVDYFNVSKKEYKIRKEEFYNKDFDKVMYRIEIYNVNGTMYILFKFHHLIFDGMSMNILINKIKDSYEGKELKFEPYILKEILDDKYNESRKYFLNKFNDNPTANNLPYDYKINNKKYIGDLINFKLDKSLNVLIEEYSKKYNLTLNSIYFGAFNILLSKYTYSKDIITGIANDIRSTVDEFNKIGMYVNTLPFRNKIDGNMNVINYLRNIKQEVFDTINHNIYTYTELANTLKLKIPLINTLYVYQSAGMNNVNINGEKTYISEFKRNTSKFDLTCEIIPNKNDTVINFEYSTELFEKETILNLSKHYNNILSYIVKNEGCKVNDIEMLSQDEISEILYNNEYKYDEEFNIVKIFENQVKKTPNKIALRFNNETITFKELNNYSNYIAKYIIDKKISKEIIAIISDRSFEMVVFILGILKSGNAYLPIDSTYPQKRIEYMVENSECKFILSKLDNNEFNFDMENITIKDIPNKKYNNVNKYIDKNDMAYILYTSGSTGLPKGVMIKYDSITNIFHYFKNEIEYMKDNKYNIGNITTISFDIFLSEVILPLANGQTVIIANEEEQKLPNRLNKLIEEGEIDVLQTTPSKFKIFIDNIESVENLRKIKYVMLMGEPLKESFVKDIKNKIKDVIIYNGYGPTEATDICTCKNVTNSDINIGKSLNNVKIIIIDKYDKLIPLNVKGEICVSGKGLALGYKNDEEKTKSNFIYSKYVNEIIYKTGDIGKYFKNKEIQCFGREDNQIKLNGLRIELNEIENIISNIDKVKENVVILKNNSLICMYTSLNDEDILYIRDYCRRYLPLYMIPNRFMKIKKFKHTPNGKIDRLNLQNTTLDIKLDRVVVFPKNKTQKIIYSILKELLELDKLSIEDEFFDIGLDSLNAIKLQVVLMNNDIKVDYGDIYKYSTIKKLADKIDNKVDKVIYDISGYNKNFNNILKTNKNTIKPKRIEVGNILLTGVTGFLGSHIVDEYIKNEKGIIYCIIRKKEKQLDINERLKKTLNFFFCSKYDKLIGKRIVAIEGDITNEKIIKNKSDLDMLKNKIKFIIHSAAIVKHFGDFKLFDEINIKGTENICKFALNNNMKLIHCSTLSVSGNSIESGSIVQNIEETDFDETDFYINQNVDNAYVYSKFKSEEIVLEYINKGLLANIIRLGNLTSRYSDGKFQLNVSENAFVNRLKSILYINAVPKNLIDIYAEFSPVDYTAKLIINVMQYFNMEKNVIHAFNHNHIYFDKLLKILKKIDINIEVVSKKEFSIIIKKILKNNSKEIQGIIGDLKEKNELEYITNINIKSEYSINYLKDIGFKWPEIDEKYIKLFIEYLEEIGYILIKKEENFNG